MGWVDRLGDEVPFHTAGGRLTLPQLLRSVLLAPLSEVVEELGGRLDRLGVLTPDEWPAARARRVRASIQEALRPEHDEVAVDLVRHGEGLQRRLGAPGAAPVLVIDVGVRAVRAQLLGVATPPGAVSGEGSPGRNGAGGSRAGRRPAIAAGFGGDLLDDRVLRHVLTQVPPALRAASGSDEARVELARIRAECSRARHALSSETETTVPVHLVGAGGDIRLVRSELEALLDDDLRRILDAGQRAVESGGGSVGRVLLIGGCSRTPRLVQLASARWSSPVDRPEDPECYALLGALDVVTDAWVREAESVDRQPHHAVAAAGSTAVGVSTLAAAAVGSRRTGHGASPAANPADVVIDEHEHAGSPAWMSAGGGGEHLVGSGPHRRAHPALVGAALVVALTGVSGAAMALLPDMDANAGPSRIVTQTTTETVTLGGAGAGQALLVPWAPGAGTRPAADSVQSESGPMPAPVRVLPGAPVAHPGVAPDTLAGVSVDSGVAGGQIADPSPARARSADGTQKASGATAAGDPSTPDTSSTQPTSSGRPPSTPPSTAPSVTPPQPGPSTPAPGDPAPTNPVVEPVPDPTTPEPVPDPTTPDPVPDPTTPDPAPTNPDNQDPGPSGPDPGDPAPPDPGAGSTGGDQEPGEPTPTDPQDGGGGTDPGTVP
ncbi:Hsp70 family protein [Ornithinimicrobium cerasi]|uniref:Hsp70 family protein n=1 Tax=Ornithinimicrobium cerasi TaxID=2248773 RepID=UPI00137B75F5|nr:Hsp70 family protein [Ornithinimicrobium cerasi]